MLARLAHSLHPRLNDVFSSNRLLYFGSKHTWGCSEATTVRSRTPVTYHGCTRPARRFCGPTRTPLDRRRLAATTASCTPRMCVIRSFCMQIPMADLYSTETQARIDEHCLSLRQGRHERLRERLSAIYRALQCVPSLPQQRCLAQLN